MSAVPSSRKIRVYCDIAVSLALLFSGLETAIMWHVFTTLLPNGEHRIDYVDEIEMMTLVLNVALPIGIGCYAISTIVKIRARALEAFSAATAGAGLVGVFACAMAMYGFFVAIHPGVNLWSKIWWASPFNAVVFIFVIGVPSLLFALRPRPDAPHR